MVRLDGQEMVGGVVSSTVMVWVHCELLPQASVAVQVLVVVPLLLVSAYVITGEGSQLSTAVA